MLWVRTGIGPALARGMPRFSPGHANPASFGPASAAGQWHSIAPRACRGSTGPPLVCPARRAGISFYAKLLAVVPCQGPFSGAKNSLRGVAVIALGCPRASYCELKRSPCCSLWHGFRS